MPGYSDQVKPLSPRQAIFVREYLRNSDATAAAVAAGYSVVSAPERGNRLLRTCPAVMKAVDDALKMIQVKGVHNIEKAMGEADDAIAFSLKTENANAYVKAVELKAKLAGLLIDRKDVRSMNGFRIEIGGLGNAG
jgi:phage terminase small subunit